MAKEALFKQSNAWRKIVATFFKTNGVWKQAIPFIKVDGEWIEIGESVDREFHIVVAYRADTGFRLKKIDSQGDTVIETPIPSQVFRMATDPRGWVFLAEANVTGRLLDADGNQVWAIGGLAGETTTSAAIDAGGNAYINYSNGQARKIGPDGNQVWLGRGRTSGLQGIAVDVTENVYLVYTLGYAYQLDPSGNTVWGVQHGLDEGQDIAVDATPFIYIARANGYVQKLDSSGGLVWQERPSTLTLNSIDVDQQGNIYTSTAFIVYKLLPDGSLDWSYEPGVSSIVNISVDPNRFTYVALQNGEIHKLDHNGDPIDVFNVQAVTLMRMALEPGRYGAFPSHW